MAATKPLGALMNDSVEFFTSHLNAVLVGAAVFGVIGFGAGWLVMDSAVGTMGGNMMWQDEMEGIGERMKELQEKAMTGEMNESDETEMEALTQEMMGSFGKMGGLWAAMLPAIGLSLLVSIIIAIVAKSYYLIIAVKGMTDTGAAVQTTMNKIVPLVGLWIWIFLRSFIWIPFLGIIIAIVLAPRFILSPLYLLEQNKGVMDSVTLSYKATTGYWGKIFGNALVAVILIVIASVILSTIAGMILGSTVAGLVMAVISQILAAFMVIFSMQLARTVMAAGPRA